MEKVFALTKCIIDFILFYWFSSLFFTKKKLHLVNYGLFLILATLLWAVNYSMQPILNTIFALLFALIINFRFFINTPIKILICSIAEIVLIVASETIPILISSFFENSNLVEVMNKTIQNAGFNLIGSGIFSIFVLSTYFFIKYRRKKTLDVTITSNYCIILVPIISIFIIYYIIYISQQTIFDNITRWLTLIIYWGILFTNIMVLIGERNLNRRNILQQENDLLCKYKEMSSLLFEQQNHYLQELANFAHDYSKQLEGIKTIIKAENNNHTIKETSRYVKEMKDTIKKHYQFASIKTTPLRHILLKTQIQCNTYRISLITDISYGNFDFISFLDIYSLFENLLENSIEACKLIESKNITKYIKVDIKRNKGMIYIYIENSIEKSINEKNKIFITNKENKNAHGKGINIIKNITNKYNGIYDIDYSSQYFSFSIILPVDS